MDKAANLVAQALKYFLDMRQEDQSSFAEKIGISPQVVSKYATGKIDYRIGALDRLSEALGIQPHELLIDYEAKPQKESKEVLEAIRLLKNLKPHDLETVLRLLKTLQPVPGLLSKKE